MNREFTKYGVGFLGATAWVGLSDTTSVLSLMIGGLCLAALACWFSLRIRREIRTIRDDNRQARERRETRKRERRVGGRPTGSSSGEARS
ncbi:hypothetical protein AB0899_13900 [Streptomyces sp. NPDC007002]|uniref:hypothetical protein n=1 Tax=Streptomyces sp. NPDC007002 TaxID=3156910 RepID=UPI0034566D01